MPRLCHPIFLLCHFVFFHFNSFSFFSSGQSHYFQFFFTQFS